MDNLSRIRRFKSSKFNTTASNRRTFISEGKKLSLTTPTPSTTPTKPQAKLSLILTSIILLTGAFSVLGFYLVENSSSEQQPVINNSPVTKEPVSLTLNLSSPDDNILVFDKDLLIQGNTSANAYIVVSLNDKDSILNAASNGNFSATLELQKGLNQFQITALDSFGNNKKENRTVYYSTEKI